MPPRRLLIHALPFITLLPLACTARHPTALYRLTTDPARMSALAFSPHDHFVAAAAPDGLLRIYDLSTRAAVAQATDYAPHGLYMYQPTGLAFSPTAALLAYAATDHTTHLWNFADNTTLKLQGHPLPINTATFSPDGKQLVTASGGLTYPDALGPAPPSPQPDSRDATRRATSPPTTTRSCPYSTPPVIHPVTVLTHDIATGKILSRVDAPGFLSVTLSDDATLFAGRHFPTTPDTRWPLTFSSPELRSASDANAPVEVRSTATGQLLSTVRAPANFQVLLSPDNHYLAIDHAAYALPAGHPVRTFDGAPAVFTDRNHLLCFQSGIGLPRDLFWATTHWFQPTYVPLPRGFTRDLGKYANPRDPSFPAFLPNPTQFSPDRTLVIDPTTTLWKVPR